MTTSVRGTRRLLVGLALFQGIAGDVLLRKDPPGLGLLLWSCLGAVGLATITRASGRTLPAAAWGWLSAALGFAVLITLRDAESLAVFSLMAGVACLVLCAWSAADGHPARGAITDYATTALGVVAHAMAGALLWLRPGPKPDPAFAPSSQPTAPEKPWLRLGIGVVAAIPLLIVFGGLFASADPVFGKGWSWLLGVDFARLVSHVIVTGWWAWIVAGFGHRVLLPRMFPETSFRVPDSPLRAPRVEVLTALSLLAALFAVFVVVQVRYLFGSDELVRATTGLTYADYARRGFFELLAVGALLMPVLLLADWLLGREPLRSAQRGLIVVLVVLLGVIVVSAAKRLTLYVAAYGWTHSRLYAAAALVWISIVAVWLVLTLLPRKRERFAVGALATGLVVLVGLHGLNPDAFIARHHLQRASRGESLDVPHASRLSADAVPVLLSGMTTLSEPDRTALREALSKRWSKPEPPDWRTWNRARARARDLVRQLP